MTALLVTSSEPGAGKTAICAGLGKHLRDDGRSAGYLRLTAAGDAADSDTAFMKALFALAEPTGSPADKIKEAYTAVSPGKDVVIVEGMGGDSPKAAEALDARVIVVEGYSKKLSPAVSGYKDFGDRLLGVVVNKVPRSQLERLQAETASQFGEAGVNILGVLPEDRALFTLTVGELAEILGGKILNSNEEAAGLVENFMLGAMVIDSGLEYFGRKSNKAVVVRGERPDAQLAALETSTKCLVLSGDKPPMSIVRHGAEEKGVPIILASKDVNAIIADIEEALGKTRFNQVKKLPRLSEIMEQHFNFPALYHGLGLAK